MTGIVDGVLSLLPPWTGAFWLKRLLSPPAFVLKHTSSVMVTKTTANNPWSDEAAEEAAYGTEYDLLSLCALVRAEVVVDRCCLLVGPLAKAKDRDYTLYALFLLTSCPPCLMLCSAEMVSR